MDNKKEEIINTLIEVEKSIKEICEGMCDACPFQSPMCYLDNIFDIRHELEQEKGQ